MELKFYAMKFVRIIYILLITTVMMTGMSCDGNNKKGSLRHAVVLKFKDSASPDAIKSVEEEFKELPNLIDNVLDFEWGLNFSDEEYTHVFFLTFTDKESLEEYIEHPSHQKFVQHLEEHLDKALVLDYFVSE